MIAAVASGMEKNKAVMIEITRRVLLGNVQTSRVLWCLGDSVDALQSEFNRACAYAKTLHAIATSVEIVNVQNDRPPSQWLAV